MSDYRNIIDQQEQMLQHAIENGEEGPWNKHGNGLLVCSYNHMTSSSSSSSSSSLQSTSRIVQKQELMELMEETVKEKGKNVEELQKKLLEAARQLDREVDPIVCACECVKDDFSSSFV